MNVNAVSLSRKYFQFDLLSLKLLLWSIKKDLKPNRARNLVLSTLLFHSNGSTKHETLFLVP